ARTLVPCAAPAGTLPPPTRNWTMHRIGNSRGLARGLLALAMLGLVGAAWVILRPDAAAQPGGGPAEEAPQGKEPPGPGGEGERGDGRKHPVRGGQQDAEVRGALQPREAPRRRLKVRRLPQRGREEADLREEDGRQQVPHEGRERGEVLRRLPQRQAGAGDH